MTCLMLLNTFKVLRRQSDKKMQEYHKVTLLSISVTYKYKQDINMKSSYIKRILQANRTEDHHNSKTVVSLRGNYVNLNKPGVFGY